MVERTAKNMKDKAVANFKILTGSGLNAVGKTAKSSGRTTSYLTVDNVEQPIRLETSSLKLSL
jgi:hypothetical protein